MTKAQLGECYWSNTL